MSINKLTLTALLLGFVSSTAIASAHSEKRVAATAGKSAYTTVAQGVSTESITPVNSTPVNPNPINSTPVNSSPVNPSPINSTPVNPNLVNPNSVNPNPVNPNNGGTQTRSFAFTFDNAFDYSSCMDIILLAYEQRLLDLEQANQNQCANDVLATFGTNIPQDLALRLVETANTHATETLENSLYPVWGIRRRVAINLGYVYDIDRDNPDILKLLNSRR